MSRPAEPAPFSLRAAIAKARAEMLASPEWLRVIYERNRAIEREMRAEEEGAT